MADYATDIVTAPEPPEAPVALPILGVKTGMDFSKEMKVKGAPYVPSSGEGGSPRPTTGLIFPR